MGGRGWWFRTRGHAVIAAEALLPDYGVIVLRCQRRRFHRGECQS